MLTQARDNYLAAIADKLGLVMSRLDISKYIPGNNGQSVCPSTGHKIRIWDVHPRSDSPVTSTVIEDVILDISFAPSGDPGDGPGTHTRYHTPHGFIYMNNAKVLAWGNMDILYNYPRSLTPTYELVNVDDIKEHALIPHIEVVSVSWVDPVNGGIVRHVNPAAGLRLGVGGKVDLNHMYTEQLNIAGVKLTTQTFIMPLSGLPQLTVTIDEVDLLLGIPFNAIRVQTQTVFYKDVRPEQLRALNVTK